ncbi:MAG: hypothetical protein RL177_690 [Bacteroidota bacterium]
MHRAVEQQVAQFRVPDLVEPGVFEVALGVDGPGFALGQGFDLVAGGRAAEAAPIAQRGGGDAEIRCPASIGGMVDEAAFTAKDVGEGHGRW